MSRDAQCLGDVFAQMEAEMLAAARAEDAREQAAWDALPQAEKDRRTAATEARLAWAEVETPDDDGDDDDEGEDAE
jgi:hypothetical protein